MPRSGAPRSRDAPPTPPRPMRGAPDGSGTVPMSENAVGALSAREMERIGLVRDAQGRHRIPIPERANIAADTVAKHAAGPRADHPALIFEADDGGQRRWTFAELDREAAAFARGLERLGVR